MTVHQLSGNLSPAYCSHLFISRSTDGSEFDCAEESLMVGAGDDEDAFTATQQGLHL